MQNKFNFDDDKDYYSSNRCLSRKGSKVHITAIKKTIDGDFIYTCEYYDPFELKEEDLVTREELINDL